MATLAKHIQIARLQGPEAGLRAYLNGRGASQLQDAYKQIQRKKSAATQLETYCKLFADKLETPLTKRERERQVALNVQGERKADDVQELAESTETTLAALIQREVMKALGISAPEPEKPALDPRIQALVDAGVSEEQAIALGQTFGLLDAPVNPVKETRKVATSTITRGTAWELLGADPEMKPQDANLGEPATNGQLWNLNVQGLLRVA